jgi:hypothetical protein
MAHRIRYLTARVILARENWRRHREGEKSAATLPFPKHPFAGVAFPLLPAPSPYPRSFRLCFLLLLVPPSPRRDRGGERQLRRRRAIAICLSHVDVRTCGKASNFLPYILLAAKGRLNIVINRNPLPDPRQSFARWCAGFF